MSYVSNNAVYEFSDSINGVPNRRNDRWTAGSSYQDGKARRNRAPKNPLVRGTTTFKAKKRSSRTRAR